MRTEGRDGMEAEQALKEKVRQLGRLTMKYETSVNLFPAENYLDAFYDYYEIRVRPHRLVPSPDSFRDTLREVSGYDVWEPIAEETESLFGTPSRVMIFDDDALSALKEELDGPDGLAPFFFVFDLMFCEYEGFTLCFLSGSNN